MIFSYRTIDSKSGLIEYNTISAKKTIVVFCKNDIFECQTFTNTTSIFVPENEMNGMSSVFDVINKLFCFAYDETPKIDFDKVDIRITNKNDKYFSFCLVEGK
jgi:hypothetical protein